VKDEIESRLGANLARVQNLVRLYQESPRARRRGLDTSDILRAAVVLLHATLEDFLRSLLEWKLPEAEAIHLRDTPLAGKKPRSTFTVEDLAAFRGASVDEVIVQSVQAGLERSTFNDPGDVERAFAQLGLSSALLVPHRNELGTLMARRHWIVHRVDRNTGRGSRATRALDNPTVERWFAAVRQLTTAVLRDL
jgi:hypothetical protein